MKLLTICNILNYFCSVFCVYSTLFYIFYSRSPLKIALRVGRLVKYLLNENEINEMEMKFNVETTFDSDVDKTSI